MLWTIIRTKEYSPAELEEFDKAERGASAEGGHGAGRPERSAVTALKGTGEKMNFYRPGLIWLGVGLVMAAALSRVNLEKELYILAGGIAIFGLLQIVAGLFQSSGHGDNGLNSILTDLKHMPATMGQLAVVQFFSWFALFAMWIYTTSAVTSQIYGTTDTASEAYNKGANWVGVLFGCLQWICRPCSIPSAPVAGKLTTVDNLPISPLLSEASA